MKDRPQIGHFAHEPLRLESRERITSARRIVIKIGSSSLTLASGELDRNAMWALASSVSDLVRGGAHVVLVSSGAIAAALRPMGLAGRPREVTMQQAAASVGQGLLIATWQAAFQQHGVHVGQVLLTERDVIQPETYRNVRGSLEAMLEIGVVPIVNENDTTATREIRFGDNDRLASLVAQVIGADLLVLLTDVDGLYTKPPKEEGAERISLVKNAAKLSGVSIGTRGSAVGTGGMITKLSAAHDAAITGTATVLTLPENFDAVLAGEDRGTFFPAGSGRRRSRLMWLKYATRGDGTLVLDAGAVKAVVSGRKSVLPVGITAVVGEFSEGVPVDLVDPDGAVIARGLSHFDAETVRQMLGRSTDEIRELLGEHAARAVVHRDELVIL